MTKLLTELTATASVIPTNKKRVFNASFCTVRLNNEVVATATLGGAYTPKDVLKEFKKAPGRFAPGKAYELAKSLQLI